MSSWLKELAVLSVVNTKKVTTFCVVFLKLFRVLMLEKTSTEVQRDLVNDKHATQL